MRPKITILQLFSRVVYFSAPAKMAALCRTNRVIENAESVMKLISIQDGKIMGSGMQNSNKQHNHQDQNSGIVWVIGDHAPNCPLKCRGKEGFGDKLHKAVK